MPIKTNFNLKNSGYNNILFKSFNHLLQNITDYCFIKPYLPLRKKKYYSHILLSKIFILLFI